MKAGWGKYVNIVGKRTGHLTPMSCALNVANVSDMLFIVSYNIKEKT